MDISTDVPNITFPFSELESTINSSFSIPTSSETVEKILHRLLAKIEPPDSLSEMFSSLSPSSKSCVIAYIILFLIGAPGNLFVFLSVGRQRWRRRLSRLPRIKVLIWNLAVADLFVTFVVIPIEIFWRLTVQWYGGNVLCKMIQFFKAFGLYLSSMVIVCISIDRLLAVVFPLRVLNGMTRTRNMLGTAWVSAIVFAAPQMLVFSVQKHPIFSTFRFCTNSQYFPSFNEEILYNLFSLVVMYFAPLLVIIVTLMIVLFTISKKSRELRRHQSEKRRRSNELRRSDNASVIIRARNKTMWVSITIVSVFFICWTPYVVMVLVYMLDFEAAEKLVNPRIQEALFVTAVSNSCLNPIIYGNYMRGCWKCQQPIRR